MENVTKIAAVVPVTDEMIEDERQRRRALGLDENTGLPADD